jgi:hypothetical protein
MLMRHGSCAVICDALACAVPVALRAPVLTGAITVAAVSFRAVQLTLCASVAMRFVNALWHAAVGLRLMR